MRHFAALICFLLAVSHGSAVSAVIEGNEARERIETTQERFVGSSASESAADQVLEFALQEGSDSTVSDVTRTFAIVDQDHTGRRRLWSPLLSY